jgi:chaperone required for assembly of F1-ATPase
MKAARRFYREVSVGDGHTILLDGKPVKTPSGAALALPSRALAEAVAAEWGAQGEVLKPAAMILTKLANTAIDRVAADRREAHMQILAFAGSDLLCYRAEAPQELAQRQRASWDPMLEWARQTYGAELVSGAALVPIAQPREAMAALERVLASRDAFALAALVSAAALLGSAILALALADGWLDADTAFALSQLDADFQAQRWGRDAEAEAKAINKRAELIQITEFFRLLAGDGRIGSRSSN